MLLSLFQRGQRFSQVDLILQGLKKFNIIHWNHSYHRFSPPGQDHALFPVSGPVYHV